MGFDAAVVGGGLAGSAVAIHLAKSGRSVVLFEKEKQAHHKVCGEFLSAECVPMLRELGIELPTSAPPIRSLRLHGYGSQVSASLPFVAHGLSRYWLDEVLLRRAQAVGVQVRRGELVQDVRNTDGFVVQTNQGELAAQDVFWATGKHEAAHVHRRVETDRAWLGYKMHFHITESVREKLRHTIDLALFPQAYGGWVLVEDGSANLCLAVRKGWAQQHEFSWSVILQSLCAQNVEWAELLLDAKPCWPRPLTVANIPYGYSAAEPMPFYVLGDQAAVVPSFAGDGMAMALWSAKCAAEHHLAGGHVRNFAARLRRDFSGVLRMNRVLQGALLRPSVAQTLLWSLARCPQIMPWVVKRTRLPPVDA